MAISQFAADFIEILTREVPPQAVRTEKDLEREFVVPIATRAVARHPQVLVYSHPFRNRTCCVPVCAGAPPAGRGRVVGCPKCWAESKAWACVAAFGTNHTFDLVARDRDLKSLALEVKVAAVVAGRMPNGQIQRFLGQCSLAATSHDVVIGLCGLHGRLSEKWHRNTENAMKWFRGRNVYLIFRQLG